MATTTPKTRTAPRATVGARLLGASARLWTRRQYGFVGLAGGTVFFCLSLTPSLLPRGYLFQGLISGLLAAIGYGLGVLAVWLVRHLTERPLPRATPAAWWTLAAVAAVATVVFLVLGAGWQRDIHRLMGVDSPPGPGFVVVLPIAAVTAALFVGLVRLLRRAAQRLAALLGRWIPAAAARVIAGMAVVALLLGILNGVVLDGAFAVADGTFRTINGETDPDTPPPQDSLRSGGPSSLVSWDSLGNQGRRFISGGPDAAALQRFGGPGGQSPIRVYIGLDAA
jgi:uncharacterized membrane protein